MLDGFAVLPIIFGMIDNVLKCSFNLGPGISRPSLPFFRCTFHLFLLVFLHGFIRITRRTHKGHQA